MNNKILSFINKCEGWKVEIKELHWASKNLSQHKLCDDIASAISDFEDLVSEVEQSISGKIELNTLNPDKASETNLKDFVEDVISSSKDFLKELEGMGEEYIGIKSECESFIGTMQRNLYLVNFTMKEELKARLKAKINESMPKSLERHDEVDKFMGRKPKTMKARINQIYKIVKKYGIDSRLYSDEHWQAIDDYYKAIASLGCEVEMKPCGDIRHIDSMQSDGGYCDYAEDGMPRSKQYAIKILFDDGMSIEGYIKCMAAGTVSDPFARYDTCIVLWPKSNKKLALENMEKVYKLTESELKQLVRESASKILEDLSLADREKNMQNQMSWGIHDKMNEPDDFNKLSDLIDNGAKYQAHTRDLHSEDPEMWKKITGVRESEIKIKPSKEGTFTAAAKKHGKSVQGFASQVLNNKDSYSPAMVKKANFAKNASKWNKK